jgi:hypothetical protein
MSNKVLLKRSSVAGRVPSASTLEYGELALNYSDGVLYYKDTSNTVQSISGSGAGSSNLDGLTDVTIAGVADGDVLQYDSGTGEWVNAPAGSVSTAFDGLADVTLTDVAPSQLVHYDGTEWKNDYKYNIVPNIPFVTEAGSQQYLDLINARDLTTVSGFLNNVVTQSYYLPFTKADGSYVTTLVVG